MILSSSVLAAARFACLAGMLCAAVPAPAAGPSGDGVEPAPMRSLDLTSLEQRVRETNAISVFQKLALQQEVDEMLARFRHAHASGDTELAALRRPYERLIASIQARLVRDPQLAREVSASREAIWGVLTDRARFASL